MVAPLLACFAATLALAQSNIPQIQHVIVVIQENRTPDNLFGSDAFANQHQLPGADLVQTGQCYITAPPETVPLQPLALGTTCDPSHGHNDWKTTYQGGLMDGACAVRTANCGAMSNPQYTYVQSSDVVPYFQIAQQYGYANYFFQTNQGPSFPAHQFLLSGTSAPTDPSDPTVCYYGMSEHFPCYQWFASENGNPWQDPYGCTSQSIIVQEINPNADESQGYNSGHPCYSHNTLDTLLDSQTVPISWKYYAQTSTQTTTPATSLWTAPNAISGICGLSGGSCTGHDWVNNVASVFPNSSGYPNSYSPILTDLGADPNQKQCTLPAVSWVVPDGHWSDHGGQDPNGLGPSWVTAIVNAVGGWDNSNHKLAKQCGYWANTVVLITWDDWGGWYDHVLPWRCSAGPGGTCLGYDNGTRQGVAGEYVYGFRVPLMVVSAYAKQGYISGACGQLGQPGCPNEQQQYVHDFGSILNFIEYTFGNNGQPLHFPGSAPTSGISPSYPYADVFAPDGPVVCGSNCPHPYSIADFFDFTNQRTFKPITGSGLTATNCFLVPSACFANFVPGDPDDDAVDPQD